MADNLLDKASILLTPTAYNDGSMLSVKPENGDGDFTFSRSSAATRVNAQGLVENVQIISSELVSNGNFSQIGTEEVSNGNFSQEGSELVTNGDFATDSDWSKGTGWSIGDGVATHTGSQSLLAQYNIITIGKSYRISFDLTNADDSNYVRLISSQYPNGGDYKTDGTHVVYTSTNIAHFWIYGIGDVSIDNVSVKEVGQDWSLGSGWSVGDGVAVADNAPDGERLRQNNVFVSGKTYKVTYEITEISQGGFRGYVGGTNLTTRSAVGTYTETLIAPLNDVFYIRAIGTTSGSVTNISVKEVGQDWTFHSGWSVDQANSKAIGDGTSFTYITQSPISIQNKKVKLTFDISDYVSGTFRLLPSDRQDGLDERFSSNGSYEVVYISTIDTFRFQQQAFNGSITNISVKEVTDDTDLPRIDYTDGCGSWLLEPQSTNLINT